MAGAAGSKPIPYRLYQDAARRVPLVVDVPVSGRVPDTGTVELPLYARIERLAQVMGGRQKLQPLSVGAVVDHGDLAAFQTVIGQHHRTRAALAQEGKAIDPVAQFGRHVQLGCRLTAAGGKDQPRAAQLAVNPGRVGAMGGDLQLGTSTNCSAFLFQNSDGNYTMVVGHQVS